MEEEGKEEEGREVTELIETLVYLSNLEMGKYHLIPEYRVIVHWDYLPGHSSTSLKVYTVEDNEKGILILDKWGYLMGAYRRGRWSQKILDDKEKIDKMKEDHEWSLTYERKKEREKAYSEIDY